MDTQNISPLRLLLKAAVLFVGLNLLFAALNPLPALGQLSLYNSLLPGRQRLPYGDDPQRSYNLNLYSVEAMFASHVLAGAPKPADEFRVFVIGDSSVWGFLLENKDTLTAALNAAHLHSADGRRAVFYNLGHPTISLTKDLMILDEAMQYQPDLILWPTTLEAFPWDKQLASPLVQNNPQRVSALVATYKLPSAVDPLATIYGAPLSNLSLIRQRRNLADLLRLQLYGFAWAATGIDVHIPDEYERHAVDLAADENYGSLQPPLQPSQLAFEVLAAGQQRAGDVPVLIINEPIFVGHGANSDLRYNSFYPRWAYDDYRSLLAAEADAQGWHYIDLWQAADNDEFTNTPIHLTPQGTLLLAYELLQTLSTQFDLNP
ncbi:MAG: SGNH/GDSL hydrolase family protein [Anaerolineales bacterium]|nr:SGNH/GDSL hydrolase family protein [Anaerolineales bacterium]